MKTVFVNVGALDPKATCPVAKRDELVEDVGKSFGLFSDGNQPFLSIPIKRLMELVKIFSAPARIGKSSLEAADPLLHLPFPVDGMKDMPFSIDLIASLEILGIVGVTFFWERLLWRNFIKEKLSPMIMRTIDLGSRKFAIWGRLGRMFRFASSGSER